jgi:PAS domain-containing protein
MSARLQLERARVASETLAVIGLPALVLDEQGKILAANHLIEALTGYVHWRARDRVSLSDRAADQLLRDAVATIELAGGSGVRSFPVRDTGADAMMVAHVVPIRLSAGDIFVRCAAVLVLTPVALPQAPPIELVQSLFDLTPRLASRAVSTPAKPWTTSPPMVEFPRIQYERKCAACWKRLAATAKSTSSHCSPRFPRRG